jgi:hypothetical protein
MIEYYLLPFVSRHHFVLISEDLKNCKGSFWSSLQTISLYLLKLDSEILLIYRLTVFDLNSTKVQLTMLI